MKSKTNNQSTNVISSNVNSLLTSVNVETLKKNNTINNMKNNEDGSSSGGDGGGKGGGGKVKCDYSWFNKWCLDGSNVSQLTKEQWPVGYNPEMNISK